MSYLGRPFFNFPVNWATAPAQQCSYNLNEIQLGFAIPRMEPLQLNTAQGFQFSILLENETAISAFDDFVDGTFGRLTGFWIASPFDAFEILGAGGDANHFYIRNQGLAAFFEDHSCRQLSFTKNGAVIFGKITSVLATLDNRELVGVEPDPFAWTAIDETWDCNKLLYVRFDADGEDADFIADNVQTRSLSLVELPNEYEEIETGQVPVYLYEFFIQVSDGLVYWRLTGLNEDVVSGGITFTSSPIEHGALTESVTQDQDNFEIFSVYETGNPLAQFFPFTLPRSLWVTVYEIDYSSPDVRRTIFSGDVEKIALKGKRITATCSSITTALGRRFPRFQIQPRCNYFLFSAPCGLNKEDFRYDIVIQTSVGKRVTVGLSAAPTDNHFTGAPANYFALGWLETGSGQQTEIRGIDVSSAEGDGQITLTLSSPLNFWSEDAVGKIYPGCDGAAATCDTKYNNFRRWGGHVMSPTNLSVRAMQAETANGNKK